MRWEGVIAVTSLTCVLAAALISVVRQGPYGAPSPPLDLGYAWRALHDRSLRLATFGYLGHMWELYALWAWLPAFIAASTAQAGAPAGRLTAALLTFAALGPAGFAGCILGGRLATASGAPR